MARFGQSNGPIRLRNATIPGCFDDRAEDLVKLDFTLWDGRITDRGGKDVDLDHAMVLPCFVDMHTHIDKGHIWPRAANPDGTFTGALASVTRDRTENWSTRDVRARMEFSLKCAYAHGTRALRTHLDSAAPQDRISWPVFVEMRDRWAGRIDLQGCSLIGCETYDDILTGYAPTADIVASAGGTLGMVTYQVPDIRQRILDLFELAGARGLDVDFHSDETLDPTSDTLRLIADIALEIGWTDPITVGHCCALSVQDSARALETLDRVARAGINIVSLPMCNLYLQDRRAHATPRHRGITLVHEMRARGINVSFASDNTRDPFFAYGDLDMLEVMREATRIGHLDHSIPGWPAAFATNPARACGFEPPALTPGAPADFIVFKARNWTELFSRPQTDRIVVRNGEMIDTTLPDYAELDHLMEV